MFFFWFTSRLLFILNVKQELVHSFTNQTVDSLTPCWFRLNDQVFVLFKHLSKKLFVGSKKETTNECVSSSENAFNQIFKLIPQSLKIMEQVCIWSIEYYLLFLLVLFIYF